MAATHLGAVPSMQSCFLACSWSLSTDQGRKVTTSLKANGADKQIPCDSSTAEVPSEASPQNAQSHCHTCPCPLNPTVLPMGPVLSAPPSSPRLTFLFCTVISWCLAGRVGVGEGCWREKWGSSHSLRSVCGSQVASVRVVNKSGEVKHASPVQFQGQDWCSRWLPASPSC